MEEPRILSGGVQPISNRSTTSKLPLTADELKEERTMVNNHVPVPGPSEPLQFTVIEGLQVGRGVARIDPADMTALGCVPGDTVLIIGARTTAAKVVPLGMLERGQRVIQMDSQVRQNCSTGLHEKVTLRKAEVKDAEKVTLLPLSTGAPIQEEELKHVARYMVGLPVTIGDLLRVGMPGAAPREYLIISTSPATPAYTVQSKSGDVEVSVGAPNATGPLPELPVQPEPVPHEIEAVLVQPNTIVKAQARGANRQGDWGHVRYEDIGGLGKELQRIREMIELPLKYPAVFDRLGIEPPKGILLYGPPGTGKTLIARAVASESNAAFFVINGPEIMNKLYGESESRLRGIFQEAQKHAPSIIFIDELDALAPRRAESGGEAERRVVGQLLTLMDGKEGRGQVVIIGATNQPNALDPALRRPGRFDREISLRVPDVNGRKEILQIHSQDAALANDIDFARLAHLTPGFVGADLEALCREAAMIALRRVLPHIDYEHGYIPYETLVNLNITMADFQDALREVEPSTTREVYVEISETSWDDIGGMVDVKDSLTESVEWPLRFPEIYSSAKVQMPRGLLLSGPPGSGKTLLARALAHQCEASFISIKGPELISKWIGETEKGIREVFRRAKQAAPCIVFFDEIDGLAPRRGGGLDGHAGDRLLTQLLTEMDGIEGRAGVIVVAATNRPELLDPALLRPGRFDMVVELRLPNEEERESIFSVHTRGRPLASDVSLSKLAQLTEGRSGADIEGICRRASLLALREWITPRLQLARVQVSEAGEDGKNLPTPLSSASSPFSDTGALAAQYQMRMDHFLRALEEQNERYTSMQASSEAQRKREEGQQRLLEMAANQSASGQRPLRGFRLFLARLFGLA
ncbi:MAG TPA: CDC48 family AAA ATPase [Ktedonobacteraceae bacterium]|nr:CDC48 family AAA ATPase [Ktedonobacteraceae bacterium]